LTSFPNRHRDVVRRKKVKGERFLYLYLSVMLAVFSVLFVADICSKIGVTTFPKSELATYRSPNYEELDKYLRSTSKVLFKDTIEIFDAKSTHFREGGLEALNFILQSHDMHARILVIGDLEDYELYYGRALLLQSALEEFSLDVQDVRIELEFAPNSREQIVVTLYEGASPSGETI